MLPPSIRGIELGAIASFDMHNGSVDLRDALRIATLLYIRMFLQR